MESPLKMLLEWYHSLPVSHRNEIAGIISILTNDVGSASDNTDMPGNPSERFIEKLETMVAIPFRTTGICLMLRSYIDFFVINIKDFDELQSRLQFARQFFNSGLNGDTKIDQLIEQLPFRKEQWKVTTRKWNQLKSEYLCDDYLKKWEKFIVYQAR